MSLVLNTNINSMVAQNSLTTSGNQLSTSLEQLSSGLRINTAADNAAGYAIVQGMTSQINGLNQASQNASDGVSLTQTGSGALQEVTNDLQTMRDLAVQSLNATNSSTDRADLDQQFQQLSADVDNVAKTTAFNGVNLLDGTFQGAAFQIGANVGQTITVSSVGSQRTAALGVYTGTNQSQQAVTYNAAASALTVQAGTGPSIALGTVATDASAIAAAINAGGVAGLSATANATSAVGTATTTVGTASGVSTFTLNGTTISANVVTGNALTTKANTLQAINAVSASTGVTATDNGSGLTLSSATGATIVVANFAAGTATAATQGDLGLGGITNQTGTVNVSYNAPAGTSGSLVFTGAGFGQSYAIASTGTSIAASNVLTTTSSNAALTSIDAALQQVATTGAQLGAYQNRFQAAITGLNTTETNLQAARSSIQDTDYAQATSDLSKAQILQQASTAMVAQANTVPQNVLSLIQKLP
jgi:flagellin